LLVIFVVPGLKGLFVDLGAPLPPVTGLILDIGDLFLCLWYLPIILVGIITVIILGIKRKKPHKLEEMIFRAPFIGRLIKQEMVIQGLGTLGSLLAGGTPIIEAMEITANSSKSTIFKRSILEAKEEVENGVRLSESLEKSRFFGQEIIQMLRVGENSGQLAEMLVNISDFQGKEREVLLKRFTTLLEPAMTLTVGVVVGFIVLAMFLPIVNMVSSLQ
jgi:type IV pilus assembly protein PilC